jgi:hypothetical protein
MTKNTSQDELDSFLSKMDEIISQGLNEIQQQREKFNKFF